jgi:bilin biosynthesis protein
MISCADYTMFYSTIASSVGALISISAAVVIYLLQQRSQKRETIELELNKLDILIGTYCNISESAVGNIAVHQNRDVQEHVDLVIQNFNNWKHLNHISNKYVYEEKHYRPFLDSLNSLQYKIYKVLIKKLHRVSQLDPYEKNYRYIVCMDDYEWYIKTVYPYLNKIEGINTQLGGGNIQKENIDYRSDQLEKKNEEFYAGYWDILLKIRTKSSEINKMVEEFYQGNILNSLMGSYKSTRYILISFIIVGVFGFIVPLYMIQPNKFIGYLPCKYVFDSTIVASIIIIFCVSKALDNRYRYLMISLESVIETLKNHEKEGFRRKAAEDLGNIRDMRAVKPLKKALKNEQSKIVQLAAIGALVKLGKTEYLDQIIERIKDEDSAVRSYAVDVLGDIRDPLALDPLIAAIDDDNESVRFRAALSLGNIGGPRAKEALIKCAKDDESDMVRKWAIFSLDSID